MKSVDKEYGLLTTVIIYYGLLFQKLKTFSLTFKLKYGTVTSKQMIQCKRKPNQQKRKPTFNFTVLMVILFTGNSHMPMY